jgi:hypothetical protein
LTPLTAAGPALRVDHRSDLSEINDRWAVTLPVMTGSLVYLLLRQVPRMLTQLAAGGGAKDVELRLLPHQVAALRRQPATGTWLARSILAAHSAAIPRPVPQLQLPIGVNGGRRSSAKPTRSAVDAGRQM